LSISKTGEQNKGSSFSTEAASLYTLFCIFTGEKLHSVLYNPNSRSFLPSRVDRVQDFTQLRSLLKQAGKKANKRYLSVAGKHFTIVPEGVFMPEHKDDYLSILFEPGEIETKKDIRFESATGIKNTRFIYAVEAELSQLAATCGYRLKHALPAHLTPAQQLAGQHTKTPNTGFLFLYEGFFYLALFQGSFLMCNTYPLLTDADLGYYTLFAMEQFDLKGDKTTLYHAGKATDTTKKLQIVEQYVAELNPFPGDETLPGSDQNTAKKQAENFTLHSQLLCV